MTATQIITADQRQTPQTWTAASYATGTTVIATAAADQKIRVFVVQAATSVAAHSTTVSFVGGSTVYILTTSATVNGSASFNMNGLFTGAAGQNLQVVVVAGPVFLNIGYTILPATALSPEI